MSNIHFTSDLHFGHKLVAKLRGFGEHADSTKNHDDAIIKNWHSVVHPDDVVWVLGDLTASNGQIDRMLGIMSRLPGRKRLIYGNHDPVHPMHREAFKWQAKYGTAFEFQAPFAKIKVSGQYVLLSHFPYEFDHTENARYAQWRLPNQGEVLVHGHLHATKRVTSATELHVGVDAWNLTPIPLQVVEMFIDSTLASEVEYLGG